MKTGKIYFKHNKYGENDDYASSDLIEYGVMNFDENGILTDWFIDEDKLKDACDAADKLRGSPEEIKTFEFCWENSIKNKDDYDDDGEKVIEKVNVKWFNNLIKMTKQKNDALIIYKWEVKDEIGN